MTTTIYLVEDHPVMQRMLCAYLKRLPDLVLGGVAGTAAEALAALPESEAALVLIDVSLPDRSGIELVAQLHRQQPALRCLILSGHQEITYVKQALTAGARGYLEKGNPRELATAIQQVLAGEIYLSEHIRQMLAASEER